MSYRPQTFSLVGTNLSELKKAIKAEKAPEFDTKEAYSVLVEPPASPATSLELRKKLASMQELLNMYKILPRNLAGARLKSSGCEKYY